MNGAPLTAKLRELISREGPISVARYMQEALLDPEHGYYTTRDPLGQGGDFTTSPEISQIFGELIGLWSAVVWQQLGSPGRIALIEFGPGRGTLMADAFRAARGVPGFADAIEVHLVEASPSLRAIQKKALKGAPVTWHDDATGLPELPSILIANEFFDALPIHQLIFEDGAWQERRVGWDDVAGSFAWGSAPADPSLIAQVPERIAGEVTEGDIFEICAAGRSVVETLAQHIARHRGAGLFIDYGHGVSAFGDTFQGLRAHKYVDVFSDPGSADLTAHVDFDALLDLAAENGCTGFGCVTQGQFLTALGIAERAEALCARATEAQAATIRSGARRLIEPAEMGTLFKAMAITDPSVSELPGFGPPSRPRI